MKSICPKKSLANFVKTFEIASGQQSHLNYTKDLNLLTLNTNVSIYLQPKKNLRTGRFSVFFHF